MANKLPEAHYKQMAAQLREATKPRIIVTVREAAEVWGYTSTAAAQNAINNLVAIGLMSEERHGKYKKYFISYENEIHQPQTTA
jgi:Na+/alanine symporter